MLSLYRRVLFESFHCNIYKGRSVPPTLDRCFQYFFAIFQYFYGHFSIFDIFDRCDIQQ